MEGVWVNDDWVYTLTVPIIANGPVWEKDDHIWYWVNKPDGSGGITHEITALVGDVTETQVICGAATCAFPL